MSRVYYKILGSGVNAKQLNKMFLTTFIFTILTQKNVLILCCIFDNIIIKTIPLNSRKLLLSLRIEKNEFDEIYESTVILSVTHSKRMITQTSRS